jgi:hypothetical protein
LTWDELSVDEPEVVEEFEGAGLQAFSSRSGKVGGGFIDDAEVLRHG